MVNTFPMPSHSEPWQTDGGETWVPTRSFAARHCVSRNGPIATTTVFCASGEEFPLFALLKISWFCRKSSGKCVQTEL